MRLKLYSMAIVFVLLLVGCNAGQNDKNNNNIEPTRFNDNNDNDMYNRDRGRGMAPGGTTNINNRNVDNRNNGQNDQNYKVSKEAADRITDEIDEIHHAYVLTTDNNAYVAAVLDNDDRHQDRINNRNNNSGHDGIPDGTQNMSDGNRNGTRDNNDGTVNQGSAGDADLSDEVKSKISDIVQSVDRDIENVYVTTNPDFADLTNNYMNDFNNGKPVRGFFDQIGNMIERVFPQNKR